MDNNEIQDIDYKKRYLRRYRNNVRCVSRLENKLYQLTQRIESVRTASLSGMPRGGVPITIDELISDKIELEDRITRQRQKNKRIRSEILDVIDTLDDPRYCEVLEAYFIECLSISEIAEREAYTDRHVYRLYEDAIIRLSVPCQ